MLRPQDSPTRERKSLNGLWAFAFDPQGVGRDAGWWRGWLPAATEMPVPASFNDIAAAVRDYIGDVWYQTTVRVPCSPIATGRVSASGPWRSTAPGS